MRSIPCSSRFWANFSLAAAEGWNPSQKTYCVAFEHVPWDLALQRNDVSIVPVPQQAFLDSKNPEKPKIIIRRILNDKITNYKLECSPSRIAFLLFFFSLVLVIMLIQEVCWLKEIQIFWFFKYKTETWWCFGWQSDILYCSCRYHEFCENLPLSAGLTIISSSGWYISKTTSFNPGSLVFKFCDVLSSLLLKEIASWFSLATHWLLPAPNKVIAAGKHPVGGKFVTPILRAPKLYKFCQKRDYFPYQ